MKLYEKETYGLGIWGKADYNKFTGDWSYLFYYDEDDMPIGTHQLTIKFLPKYEEEIIISQEIIMFMSIEIG